MKKPGMNGEKYIAVKKFHTKERLHMMKRFCAFCVVWAVLLCMVFPVYAEVEQDTELHRVIGGLYSLAAAVNLNGGVNPGTASLRRYFGSDVPSDWLSASKVVREGGAVWVGVPVGKYSSARQYLRNNSKELAVFDSPGGYAWLGGDYAWMKAADISGNSIRPVKILASMGSGSDSDAVFFSTQGRPEWWQASPSFGANSAKMVIDMFGVKNAPELHRPGGVSRSSIYDEVRPSSVGMPGKMHVGHRKSSFDMSIEMGDVIFNPIPNTR